jgi:hypothetical protein
MKRHMRYLIALGAALVVGILAWPAMAVGTATPFGAATIVDGNLQLVSNTATPDTADDFGGVTLSGTGVTTFASITMLATEFNVTDDDCKSGSPRFQIRVTTATGPKNIFVYLGPAPNFTGCTPNTWLSTGNFIAPADLTLRFDISQLVPGGQMSTYQQALTAAGSLTVESISLVVDSGGAFDDKEQTVLFRNLKVNGDTFYVFPAPPPTTDGMNPAKACAAIRAQMGVEAFKLKYGTNVNRANAFGKCVSAMARLKTDAARVKAVKLTVKEGKACVRVHGKAKGLSKGKKAALRACLVKAG